jgi:hypothetical protein
MVARWRVLRASRGGAGEDAGERKLLGLTQASVERQSDGRIDLGCRNVGWSVEVGVEGQAVLILKAVDFEGAEGFVGFDLWAAALPFGPGVEAGSGLLQGVKKQCGAAVLDGVFGECVDHLLKTVLNGVHVVEDRHLQAAGLAMETSVRGLHTAGTGIEVEVAVTLISESGRTAVDAICLEMVTGTVGHDASKIWAISCQPSAFS